MRPMSWCSGSQDTPTCGSPSRRPAPSARWRRAATSGWCVSATGLGSTVDPEENWIRPSPSGRPPEAEARSDPGASRPGSPSAGPRSTMASPRQPLACGASVSTNRRARELDHPRGGGVILVEAAQPERRRERHRDGAGQRRAEERVEERRPGRQHQRHPIARAHAERRQRAGDPRRARERALVPAERLLGLVRRHEGEPPPPRSGGPLQRLVNSGVAGGGLASALGRAGFTATAPSRAAT